MMIARLQQLDVLHGWPLIVAAGYVLMSFITLAAFAIDKSRATSGRHRIAEATLHGLALLGGWPGAMIGMTLFRHKRRKTRFVVFTWLIALAHAAGWAWWLTRARG